MQTPLRNQIPYHDRAWRFLEKNWCGNSSTSLLRLYRPISCKHWNILSPSYTYPDNSSVADINPAATVAHPWFQLNRLYNLEHSALLRSAFHIFPCNSNSPTSCPRVHLDGAFPSPNISSNSVCRFPSHAPSPWHQAMLLHQLWSKPLNDSQYYRVHQQQFERRPFCI